MSENVTEQQIEELRRLYAAAPLGRAWDTPADWNVCVAAVQALPDLLDEITRLRAEVASARAKALEEAAAAVAAIYPYLGERGWEVLKRADAALRALSSSPAKP
jgi:hypothetical protein